MDLANVRCWVVSILTQKKPAHPCLLLVDVISDIDGMDPVNFRCWVKPILTQKQPAQPCFLLLGIIDMQEGRKPPTPHLDPFIPMWMMNNAKIKLGILPM